MKAAMKLHILLALCQDASARFGAMITDYTKYFKGSQGAFQGNKETYIPQDTAVDDPSKRGFKMVTTTVDEKLNYFIKNSDLVELLMSKERTNASGNAKAELFVEGKSWGEYYAGELLALKGLVDNKIHSLISEIPVKTETEEWILCEEELYAGRGIYMLKPVTQVIKTTEKMQRILEDPNVLTGKVTSYHPQITTIDTVKELGTQVRYVYNGMWTHRLRAAALSRLITLRDAVTIALQQANTCDVVQSPMTGEKLFKYIFEGENA